MNRVMTAQSSGAQIEIIGIGDGTPSMLTAKCPPGYYYSGYGPGAAMLQVEATYADVNLRGFNGSLIENIEKADYGLAEYIADFDAAIQKVGAKQPVLFGYSHCGYFTTAYAMAKPGGVRGLILVEPALFTDPSDLEERARLADAGDGKKSIEAMLRYVDPKTGLDRAVADRTARRIMGHVQHPKVLSMEFRIRAKNPVKEQDLKALEMPVLLIGGSDSAVRDMVERAAGLIPNASTWWVRGADHLSIMEREFADELSMVVNLFLSKL
jgi:pimeloyl-ACP methyl ester carboxylesterase